MERQRRRLVDHHLHDSAFSQGATVQAGDVVTPYALQNRRKARSRELMDAAQKLDMTTDPQVRRELGEWIAKLYEERGGGQPIGLFAHCYLGAPYIDHRLDLAGSIITHFTPQEPVPPAYAMARPLARSTAYLFIEVYEDGQVVPVRDDGTSAV